jgi:hypothetical protein
MNWQTQAANSHYQTAVAIGRELTAGRVQEAQAGLQELIDALGRSERRALKSQLTRLMAHIIKWQTQPENRSRSWLASIHGARVEIKDIQDETPSLTDDIIRSIWNSCFDLAKEQAEAEMDQATNIDALTWDEVFVADYRIGSNETN